MNIPDLSASYLGKLSSKLLSCFGFNATSAPGLLVNRIHPKLFANLLKIPERNPILVTGTNGKSTTTGFLANILKASGQKIFHNSSGANLLSGLLTSLIKTRITRDGQILFEVDEAVLKKVSSERNAELILVNNFFRDQLDRFGEMKTTINLVKQGIKLSQTGKLVLNCDDPNVCALEANKKLYFGLGCEISQEIFAEELGICPSCGEDLRYHSQWLGQFGDYYCEKCKYIRPKPDIKIYELELSTFDSRIKIDFEGKFQEAFKIPMPGLFNVYNALAAISGAYAMGVSTENIKQGIESYTPLFGRSQKVQFNNKTLNLFLIKNPIGASEVLRLISSDKDARLLICINDNYADGRDVSWLWDAHFEYLRNYTGKIFTSGTRATDMAVRLKYAGLNTSNIICIQDISEALKLFSDQATSDKNLYVLPTYTALLKITKLLKLKY